MPFDKNAVAQAIPPLEIGVAVSKNADIVRYRKYYGIDFENKKKNLRASLGYIDISGYRICVHTFQKATPKGTVFVLHGYYDHVGIYDHLVEYVIDQGFSVVIFDLPGHGLSSGDNVSIHDFHRYQIVLHSVMNRVKKIMPEPWHIVGQSTGGAIIIDFLLTGKFTAANSPFNKVILLAPLVRPQSWLAGRLMHSVVAPFTQYIDRKFVINSTDKEFLHFLQYKDPLQSKKISARWVGALKRWVPYIENTQSSALSIVVIQGLKDTTVDWKHNLTVIKEKFNKMELVLIAEGHHQLVNEAEVLRGEIFDVIGLSLKD